MLVICQSFLPMQYFTDLSKFYAANDLCCMVHSFEQTNYITLINIMQCLLYFACADQRYNSSITTLKCEVGRYRTVVS